MKEDIKERRLYMIQEYARTLSEKQAIESTANKFGTKKDVLYVDWSRQNVWLKDIIDLKDNTILIKQLLLEVSRSLQEVQKLAQNSKNDNCKLGAHKLRINTIMKLIDFLRIYDNESLRERIERLERLTKQGVFIP